MDPKGRAAADLQLAVWMHQATAGNGCDRMSVKDRRTYGGSSHDYEGVQVWPVLLTEEGPVTEVVTSTR